MFAALNVLSRLLACYSDGLLLSEQYRATGAASTHSRPGLYGRGCRRNSVADDSRVKAANGIDRYVSWLNDRWPGNRSRMSGRCRIIISTMLLLPGKIGYTRGAVALLRWLYSPGHVYEARAYVARLIIKVLIVC